MVEGSERTFQIGTVKSGIRYPTNPSLDEATSKEVVRSSPINRQRMLLEALSNSEEKRTLVTPRAVLPTMKRGFGWWINQIIASAEWGILCSPLVDDNIVFRPWGTEDLHSSYGHGVNILAIVRKPTKARSSCDPFHFHDEHLTRDQLSRGSQMTLRKAYSPVGAQPGWPELTWLPQSHPPSTVEISKSDLFASWSDQSAYEI